MIRFIPIYACLFCSSCYGLYDEPLVTYEPGPVASCVDADDDVDAGTRFDGESASSSIKDGEP